MIASILLGSAATTVAAETVDPQNRVKRPAVARPAPLELKAVTVSHRSSDGHEGRNSHVTYHAGIAHVSQRFVEAMNKKNPEAPKRHDPH